MTTNAAEADALQQENVGALARETALAIGRLVWYLRAEFEGENAPESLTRLQMWVLNDLLHGPLSMGQIARLRGILPTGATALVKRLVARGFVRRLAVEGNRRLVLIELTPDGRRVVREVEKRSTARVATLLRLLGEEDQRHLTRILRAWRPLLMEHGEY